MWLWLLLFLQWRWQQWGLEPPDTTAAGPSVASGHAEVAVHAVAAPVVGPASHSGTWPGSDSPAGGTPNLEVIAEQRVAPDHVVAEGSDDEPAVMAAPAQ